MRLRNCGASGAFLQKKACTVMLRLLVEAMEGEGMEQHMETILHYLGLHGP